MRLRLLTALLLTLACLGCSAGPALAAPGVEVGMEDERLLLSEADKAPAAIAAWKAIGVDVVRIHARWFEIAPGRTSRRRPRNRSNDWSRLDRAVALLRAADLDVLLTVTGPGPLWTTRDPRVGNPRVEPKPADFGRFAGAVARRYRDEVDRYSLWNEPNLAGWLQPQSICEGRGPRRVCEPASPHLYRDLVRAALPAIKRADPGAEVLVGDLAPLGAPRPSRGATIAPVAFLRAFGCVDARNAPIRTGRCAGFRPARADGLAFHPHGVRRGPEDPNPDPDSIGIADLPRLARALDRLTAAGRIRSPLGERLDIHLTEFSYQTSPPDRAVGISLGRQAIYQQQAAYLAWRNPRVRSLIQYQWEDELARNKGRGSKRYAGWQGGLRRHDGRRKPAQAAFEAPLVIGVTSSGFSARLWGQVRPGAEHPVTIVRGEGATGPLEVVATVPSARDGVFTFPVDPAIAARWAAFWTEPDGTVRRTAVVLAEQGSAGRVLAAVP